MLEFADLERRFASLTRLYGAQGATKIRAAHVVIIGIGGVGSWAAEALARSGVRRLTLIDLDHIAESNINRQIHALGSTVGQSKVQAMRERVADINPDCQVICIEEVVDSENWPAVAKLDVSSDTSVSVLDACDHVKAKTAMAAWSLQNNTNFITVGAAGGKRHAHKVEIEDLALATHDPLLAQVRYKLRKEHSASRQGKVGVNCVFSRESVAQPFETVINTPTDNNLNCHGYGSVVSVTATFGICAAGWLLDKIASLSSANPSKTAL